MAYADRHLFSQTLALDGATAVVTEFAVINRANIHKVAIRATNTGAGGASVVFARRRGASTDTTIATVVVPAADSNGTTFYKEITSVDFLPGDLLLATVTEGATAPTSMILVEYSINDVDLQSSVVPATTVVSA